MIDRALAAPPASTRLYWTAARVSAARGEPTAATSFAARARGLNPRVALVEPALTAPLAGPPSGKAAPKAARQAPKG